MLSSNLRVAELLATNSENYLNSRKVTLSFAGFSVSVRMTPNSQALLVALVPDLDVANPHPKVSQYKHRRHMVQYSNLPLLQ